MALFPCTCARRGHNMDGAIELQGRKTAMHTLLDSRGRRFGKILNIHGSILLFDLIIRVLIYFLQTCWCSFIGRLASTVELDKNRNQLTEASCKTCGGRPIVDGIGPVSARMLGTVGPELTNFINPELNWKMENKAHRNTTRRSRWSRSRSLNMGAEPGKKSPKRVWGSSFFESEQFYGQQFSDKIEHVPIKKRKLLLGSPSPPPQVPDSHCEESLSPQHRTFSARLEESEQSWDHKYASGQLSFLDCFSNQQRSGLNGVAFDFADGLDNGVTDGNPSKVTSEKRYSNEDFSGIALLAAAACISGVGDDADKKLVGEELPQPEGFCSFTSTLPLVENVTVDVDQKDWVHEDNIDALFVKEHSVSVSLNHKHEECRDVGTSSPSKDVRLHWDLNTVMDAWEQSCDDSTVDFRTNDLAGVAHDVIGGTEKENTEGCKRQMGSEEIQCDFNGEVQSTSEDIHQNHLLSDPNGKFIGLSRIKLEECKEEECFGHEQTCSKVKYISAHALVPSNKCPDANTSQGLTVDTILENSHVVSEKFVSEERDHVTSAGIASMTKTDDCFGSSMLLGKSVSSKTKVDDSCPQVPSPEKAGCLNSTEPGALNDFVKAAALPDKGTVLGEIIGTSDGVYPSFSSLKSEHELGCSVEEKLHILNANGKGEDDKARGADDIENSSLMHIGPGGAQCKSYSENLTAQCGEDPLLFDVTDVSQDVCNQMAGVENMTELHAGNDSPFEDGELRDPDLFPWGENDFDDGEIENVDCESDDGGGNGFGVSEEVGSDAMQNMENGSSLVMAAKDVEFSQRGSVITSNVHLRQCSGRDDCSMKIEMVQRKGGFASSGAEQRKDMILEANDDNSRKRHTSDEFNRVLYFGELGTKAFRGKLPSRIDETSSLDVFDRKRPSFVHCNRSYDLGGSYPRTERDFGSSKSMGRGRSFYMRERSEGNDPWIESKEGHLIGRNFPRPSCHGPQDPYYARQRRAFIDSGSKIDGLNCHDHRQSRFYSAKFVFRQPNGRRSPSERDDHYSGSRGVFSGMNQGGSRGGSGMYSRGVCRGFREGYNEPAHDDADTSVRMRQYLLRRDRSSSPFGRGGHIFQPHRRSSRSRTGSPAWHYQRERNFGAGRHSRSPDFRPVARMERMSFPNQRLNVAANYEESSPPSRGRFPQQHNPRWIDTRNYVDDRSRERRSPVRMSKRSHRFDSIASSWRSKSDDYYRTTIRPKRITLMASAGREHKYDDSEDERRKHDDRYQMVHRARHYDACGAVRKPMR